MVDHKLVDGVKVVLSDEEIAQRAAEEAAWNAGAFDRALNNLRQRRNALLTASDWTMHTDAPTDKVAWANYRQALRDLPAQGGDADNATFPSKPE